MSDSSIDGRLWIDRIMDLRFDMGVRMACSTGTLFFKAGREHIIDFFQNYLNQELFSGEKVVSKEAEPLNAPLLTSTH